MDAATQEQPDLPFESSSIIRLIRGFITHDRTDVADVGLPSIERSGSLLWDLTADPDAIPLLLENNLVHAVLMQLNAFVEGQIPADATASPGRIVELCFGMLANLFACSELVLLLVADAAVFSALINLFTLVDDPPALSEMCRMLTAALASPEGRAAWLPLLQQQHQHVLAHLLLLIQNTLHPQLLQQSLELLAALLQAESALIDEQQQQRQQQQEEEGGGQQQRHQEEEDKLLLLPKLMQSGLVEAIAAVLVPAAATAATAPTPEQQATATTAVGGDTAAPVSAGGGWDDDDADAIAAWAGSGAGGSSSIDQAAQQLYKQPVVIEALIAALGQLGLQPTAAEAVQQCMPQLPLLLLQLLAACSAAGQQKQLELLLPVLVLFRQGILPLLQQQELPLPQPQQQQSEQQPVSQHVEQPEQQQQPLRYLVCIGCVLQDCSSPDSLDALDAGWYLMAAGTRQLWQQQQQQQKQAGQGQEQAEQQQQQQQEEEDSGQQQGSQQQQHNDQSPSAAQQANEAAAEPGPASSSEQEPCLGACQLLARLCSCLSRARVPTTAARYAEQCASNVVAALSALSLQLPSNAVVCSSVLRIAVHAEAMLCNMKQQQQQEQDEAEGDREGAFDGLLQELAALHQKLEQQSTTFGVAPPLEP